MKRGIIHNTHPGELLKMDVIQANNLPITKAARMLGVTRPTLSKVLNGRASISPNMAIRIEKVFGGKAEFWLRMQVNYNLRKARTAFEAEPLQLERFF